MDSKSCASNNNIDTIKCLLKEGKLSVRELNECIQTIIRTELKKPSNKIDLDKVYALSDLSWRLCGSPVFHTSLQENKTGAIARLQKRKRLEHWKKRTIAVGGIATALIVLAIIGNGILYRHWLSGNSSDDDQQYLVGGTVVDPGLLEKGNAESDGASRNLRTLDFQEVVAFLGYTPDVPQWIPEGWSVHEYIVSANPTYDWVVLHYTAAHTEGLLVYQAHRYSDIHVAKASFEQNQTGEKVDSDGISVYVTSNMERLTGIWNIDSTTHNIAGPINPDDLLKMQRSIGGKGIRESM